MANGGLYFSAALGPWLSPASDLQRPLAYGALLAIVNYQGVIIRNGRVIESIVKGGGYSGRGGLGGIS